MGAKSIPIRTSPARGRGSRRWAAPRCPTRATRPTGAGTGRSARAPGIAADEPDGGGPTVSVGGGSVTEERNAPPVADPGPDA